MAKKPAASNKAAEADDTTLLDAAGSGDIRTATRLLDSGADANARATSGQSALGIAAEKLDDGMVRFLLSRGAKVDVPDTDGGGGTPLLDAAKGEDFAPACAVVTTLLDAGSAIDFVAKSGWSAIHWAVDRNNPELVKLLAARGGSLELPNYASDTTMMRAWKERKLEMFDLLRTLGARRDIPCREGFSLDQVTSVDGRGPRSVDVAVMPSAAPQTMTLRMKIAMWSVRQKHEAELKRFERMVITRALDAMAKGAFSGSSFALEDAVASAPPSSPVLGPAGIHELAYSMRIGGVGADGLLLFLRHVARASGSKAMAELSLRGEHPLVRGSAEAVDSARALAALSDPPKLETPPSLPFEVAVAARPGVRVFLPSAGDHKAAVEAVLEAWIAVATATVPGVLPVSVSMLLPRVKADKTKLTLEATGVAATPFPFSFSVAAPMLLGMLAAAKRGGLPIERVEIA